MNFIMKVSEKIKLASNPKLSFYLYSMSTKESWIDHLKPSFNGERTRAFDVIGDSSRKEWNLFNDISSLQKIDQSNLIRKLCQQNMWRGFLLGWHIQLYFPSWSLNHPDDSNSIVPYSLNYIDYEHSTDFPKSYCTESL